MFVTKYENLISSHYYSIKIYKNISSDSIRSGAYGVDLKTSHVAWQLSFQKKILGT